MTFSDSDASRIISALDERLARRLGNNSMITSTWGEVSDIDASGKFCSVLLYGETDVQYKAGDFRIPDALVVTVGYNVKVSINNATGERWVDEASVPSAYKKIAIDPISGTILTGDGTSAPAPAVFTPPVYQTTNTATSSNQWTKIASGSIGGQYGDQAFELLLGGAGSGSSSWPRGFVRGRVKQQAAFGSQPVVSLDLLGGQDTNTSCWRIIVTSVAGPTTWELWGKIIDTYTTLHFSELWSDDGSIVYYNAQTLNANPTASGTTYYCAAEGDTPTGSIVLWGTNSLPQGYVLCNGQAISRTTYAALFGVLGTTYGAGDGSTTFNVPNLVNRVPYGRNAETIGSTGGSTTHTHAGHSNHVVTQPSAHPAESHSGTAVSAHSGTAVNDHAALGTHAHELPFTIDDTTAISSLDSSVFGVGTARTRDWTAAVTGVNSSVAVAKSQAVSGGTPSAHVVTQPSAHTVTNPSDHAATSHSGTAVDGHSAHDSPSHLPPYMILNYIIKF